MRYRPEKKSTQFIIIIAAIIAVLIAKSLGFASTRSATRILYSDRESRTSWSASYVMLDGTMEKVVYSEEDVLTISVETESVSIYIEIKDNEGDVILTETFKGTDSLEIKANKRNTIRIDADKHKGSFNISARRIETKGACDNYTPVGGCNIGPTENFV